MAVAELASISERRVERLVNPALSDGLPPFLVEEGGLNSGFMIPQYVAAALVSENKVLAHPASVDSIPTSAGQEDHVSMGNAAGLKALRVLDNVERALAIELLAGTQAIEFLAPLQPGGGVRAVHDVVRTMLSAARRRPLAEPRTSSSSPRRSARVRSSRRRRPRSGRSRDRDAAVEALCGDLSAIRAPRGPSLNALSWQTEAPLRMLLNNLDAEVAEHPEKLVVYGGTGRAARSHAALKDIVRTLLRLRADETLLVQSGKPVAVFRTTESAPRVLIANSLLVPRWATWDEFRRLEAEGLTMFGQMTAGSWIYIGTQGILQGTYQTFAAAGEQHFGSPDLTRPHDPDGGPRRDGRRAAARGDDGGRGDPVRRGRREPDRAPARDALPRRGRRLAGRRARAGAWCGRARVGRCRSASSPMRRASSPSSPRAASTSTS